MALPAFLNEVDHPTFRRKLELSIRSGYIVAVLFFALGWAGWHFQLLPYHWGFAAILALKLVANSACWASLKLDRGVLVFAGCNTVADILCMTAVVYATGGQLSPLFAIYLIEITVLALLSNLGITLLAATLIMVCYGGMAYATQVGWLPQVPPPVVTAGGITTSYVLTDLARAALLVGVPTFFGAAIVRVIREKETALEKRTKELIEASRQKGQFMANITHELRTPIHGVCGLADLVASGVYGPVSDKQKHAQQEIKRSAKLLLQQIDDLLELSRADAGRLDYQPTQVDLGELLPQVLATIGWMRGTKELALELEVEDSLPMLTTDRGKLNQILINLLSNAVKFTPEGGQVVLGARGLAGERVELWVEDTGIGISTQEQQRIFEPFQQADGTSERSYGGVGLGLALVQRLAELLGAELSLESEVGHGSRFSLQLPLHDARSVADAAE